VKVLVDISVLVAAFVTRVPCADLLAHVLPEGD
jgi:hypothetical protein